MPLLLGCQARTTLTLPRELDWHDDLLGVVSTVDWHFCFSHHHFSGFCQRFRFGIFFFDHLEQRLLFFAVGATLLVIGQACTCRNQSTDYKVLFQNAQFVETAQHRGLGQDAGGFLE